MAQPKPHPPVTPILAVLSASPEALGQAEDAVSARWGRAVVESAILDFDFTDYYERQMGSGLKRRLLAFGPTMDPAELADAKLWTNRLEREFAERIGGEHPRPVNLDPGYLNDSKLVLASAKDHAHRIYLGKGVFAEITLSYRGDAWRAMPWTYPDYRSEEYLQFFTEARAAHLLARETCK